MILATSLRVRILPLFVAVFDGHFQSHKIEVKDSNLSVTGALSGESAVLKVLDSIIIY